MPLNPSPHVLAAEETLRNVDQEESLVLFHSGHRGIDADLKTCIEPQFGEWLEECLTGATDDESFAEEIREQDPVAFYSKTPSWIAMKASRACGKSVGEMTPEDVEQHGQLSIVIVDRSRRTSLYVADDQGKADHYFDDRDTLYELPFGVERGDLFSFEAFVPDVTLVGSDLIQFMKRNFPEVALTPSLANQQRSDKAQEALHWLETVTSTPAPAP